MDADFRRFMGGVKLDEPPASSNDPRWEETEGLARRLVSESKAEAALKAIEQEPARRKRWDLLLLTALLREGLGDRPLALDALEVVGDKLIAADDRTGVTRLLDRFLEPEPTNAAVRFLQYLARGEAGDEARVKLLREALEIRPDDPEIHAEISPALDRAGDTSGAREHRLRALELSLDLGRHEPVADALLRIVEEDLEHAPARVGRILLRFASQASWADAEPILDLAASELQSRAAGLLSWEDLAPVAPRTPATPVGRALLARYLLIAVARQPDPAAIIEGSGIANPAVPIEDVGTRLPKILALPPGAHVSHTTWGLGRVKASDGDNLTLSFTGRDGHKMSFGMASRSLDRLADDGLRVLGIEDAPRLRALAEAGDSEVLVRALRDVGGTATAAQLKPRLEVALPGFDWSGYWKQSKDRIKSDRRLDTSEAYRQVYRLASEGAEAAESTLPHLMPRASAEGLGLIRKFLREHPDDEARLAAYAGPFVKRWASDESLDPTARAQALCSAASWNVLDAAAAREILEDLVVQGLGPDALTLGASQEQLLDLATGSDQEEAFLWRAVESRLPRLRERGRSRLRELLGDRYARAVEQRIARGAEAPGLAVRLIEHFAANPGDPAAPSAQALAIGTIRLLERDLPDGAPERLLALLAEDGALTAKLGRGAIGEELGAQIESTILAWSGSERRLPAIFEFLRRIGLARTAETYEERRKARAQSLLAGKSTDDLDTRFAIMSRASYDKLETELKKLALDLKTVIPAAIEKARQLGDLRENAEYEAAKLRQANAAARLQELMGTLERAKILETMEVDASRIGPGVEAVLAPVEGGAPLTYWILGEGDGGPGILSYRAPLARPLLGLRAGNEATLDLPDGPRRFRVESIVKRIPK